LSETRFQLSILQSLGASGLVILGMLVVAPLHYMLTKVVDAQLSMFIFYLCSVGLTALLIYAIWKRKSPEPAFNLTIANPVTVPIIIVVTLALLFGVCAPLATLIPMPEVVKRAFMPLVGQRGFFTFMSLVIAAPILEELIFRGIVLDGLLNKYKPSTAIFFSSFLFGFVHLNPWQFVTGFILGVFAGWVYFQTRSLALTIIIHAAANSSAFLMRFIVDVEAAMDYTVSEMYDGWVNFVLVITGSLILTIGGCLMLKNEFGKNTLMQPAELIPQDAVIDDLNDKPREDDFKSVN
jgi:uncharacterized protein